jgi:hypothetical protein
MLPTTWIADLPVKKSNREARSRASLDASIRIASVWTLMTNIFVGIDRMAWDEVPGMRGLYLRR